MRYSENTLYQLGLFVVVILLINLLFYQAIIVSILLVSIVFIIFIFLLFRKAIIENVDSELVHIKNKMVEQHELTEHAFSGLQGILAQQLLVIDSELNRTLTLINEGVAELATSFKQSQHLMLSQQNDIDEFLFQSHGENNDRVSIFVERVHELNRILASCHDVLSNDEGCTLIHTSGAEVSLSASNISPTQLNSITTIKEKVTDMVEYLNEISQQMTKLIGKFSESTPLITNITSQGIRSLQFEDLTNQSLYFLKDHLVSLKEIDNALQQVKGADMNDFSIELLKLIQCCQYTKKQMQRGTQAHGISQSSMTEGSVELF